MRRLQALLPARSAARLAALLVAVVVAAASLALPAALAADRGVLLRDRDRLTAALEAGDEDAFDLPAFEGGSISVTVRAARGSDVRPALHIYRPDGVEHDPGRALRGAGGRTVRLGRVRIPEGGTGRWQVRVTDPGDAAGAYSVTARVRPPRPVRIRRLDVAAGALVVVPFAAQDGAVIGCRVTTLAGGAPAALRLADPASVQIPGTEDAFRVRRRTAAAKGVVAAQGFGFYALHVVGPADAAARYAVRIDVRGPRVKPRRETLPPELVVRGIDAGWVRQEDVGRVLALDAEGLLEGTTAAIDGGGVTVTAVNVLEGGGGEMLVDAEFDAALGPRRLVLFPPETLGESLSLDDAIDVIAPIPVLAELVVEHGPPGDDTLVLEVHGTGFRPGGTISVSDGVDVGATVVGSHTVARAVVVSVPGVAGDHDVVFTQPGPEGESADTLVGAFPLPGVSVTSLSPDRVRIPEPAALIRVTGSGFPSGTTASFSGAGVEVTATTFVSAEALDLATTVAVDAVPGVRDLTLRLPDGEGPVHRFLGRLIVAGPDPVLLAFSHVALAQGATQVPVSAHGRNFGPGDTLTASGTGVTFSDVTVVGTDEIVANATVAASASKGPRALTVTRAAGDRTSTLSGAFRVTGAVPSVAAVSPSAVGVTGAGGATREVPITVTGSDFATGATVSVTRSGGSGLSVVAGSAAVVSDTRVELTISLAGAATAGFWDVLVTNPGGLGDSGTSGDGSLEVRAANVLAVNRVLPGSGGPYGGETVTVEGSGFADGLLVDFGTVRARGTQVLDANTIVATVPTPSTASNAQATAVDVKVTPGAGSAVTLTEGYRYGRDDLRFVTLRTHPAQGATNVPRNLTSAVVVLSAPANPSTGVYGTTTGTNTFWFESLGMFTPGGIRGFGPDGRFLVFSRTGGGNLPVSAAGVYLLDIPVALRSLGGNAFAPTRLSAALNHDQQSFTLSVGATDTTPPAVATVVPANGATGQDTTARVTITFTEELDPLTVGLGSFVLTQGATGIPASLTLSDDLKTVTLTPDVELLPAKTYTTTVMPSVGDLCANAATTTALTFTTGNGTDGTAPTIDAVAVERLPASVDGSGTYVDSQGVSGRAFDVFLPRRGWSLQVSWSDLGGSGADASTFSAKCSAAVGSNAAGAELASNFAVTATGASWRFPASSPVAAGENVTFTFSLKDLAGNAATARTVTVDVTDADAEAANGGDHDPIDSRHTWILRPDLDAFTATLSSRTIPSPQQGATTSVAANGVPDLDEALRLVGLGTPNMTSDAAAAVNGLEKGTNAIVRRLFLERLRELVNERFGIDADGTHGADSVDVEFLLPGEQGSLASAPSLSTANSMDTGRPFSEISIGGTRGAETNAFTASGLIGDAWYDVRNLHAEANLDTGGSTDTGVYLLGAFKLNVSGNALFRARISDALVAVHGGTPVGEHLTDDDVLADSFDRTQSADSAKNARWDAVMDAIEHAALYASSITAHEIGHSLGLIPDGPPRTGLFGGAHWSNAFTEATSANPNTSNHLDFLGNDLMAGSTTFDSTTVTGSDFKRFSPLDLAHLLNRLLYDEGK